MKSPSVFFCLCAIFVAIHVSAATVTLTFDDLTPPPQQSGAANGPIPSGYGGLQWDNFGVIVGTQVEQQDSGYHTGIISPRNVAFNFNGESAAISSDSPFKLDSAYLTSAFQVSATVEVEGFLGGIKTYDNIYTITSNAPTLINFNYANVDQVDFVTPAADFFVMDNMTLDTPDATDTFALLSGSAAICTLGVMRKKINVRPVAERVVRGLRFSL